MNKENASSTQKPHILFKIYLSISKHIMDELWLKYGWVSPFK